MTNDNFTDTAAWQAEEELEAYLGTEEAAYGFRDGFARGAEWARTHLAAQEPTHEEVIAATLELYVRSHHSTGRQASFESLDHEEQVAWVEDGRAVLSAARATRRDEETSDEH